MEIEVKPPSFEDLCFYCLGHGKLKAMRMAITINSKSIRTDDTVVECRRCNGTGRSK